MGKVNKLALLLGVVYMIIAFATFAMSVYNKISYYEYSWLYGSEMQCYALMVLLMLNINQFRSSNAASAIVVAASLGVLVPIKLFLSYSLSGSIYIPNQNTMSLILTSIITILQIVSVGYFADCHLKNKFVTISSVLHIFAVLICFICNVTMEQYIVIPSFVTLGFLIVSYLTVKSEQ